MSGDDKPPKREILTPQDTLDTTSGDPGDRAEAAARAARRLREDEEKKRAEEEDRRLGWHGRLWRSIRARTSMIGAAVAGAFARRLPRAATWLASRMGFLERGWARYVWPFLHGLSYKPDKDGTLRLSLTGRLLIALLIFLVAWPVLKIFYVLGTVREFQGVQITFKQIIDQDRYLVFGDYVDASGAKDNMAFNVTDSWVYWNWTPDLTFAQIPLVGRCDFRTYGWYVRVPRFVPLFGRTLLVEPVIISAACTDPASAPP
ncbi:MAG: hypothetical protein JNK07_06760 [Alphaproteobacteria bacterium]|nr:hypothetical protein [Alphaproteobacteria bacterium]